MGLPRPGWAILLASLAGCQGYQPHPLVPAEILREVEQQRREGGQSLGLPGEAGPGGEEPPGFPELARSLERYSPALRQAREEYRQALALARIPAPLPNPSLALGPLLGTDLDPGQGSRRLQPFVEFGFAFPLSGRLAREDDRKQAEAEAARVGLIAAYRESYLELRRLWMELHLAHRAGEVRRQTLAASRAALDLTRRLVEAGAATALDVGLMELEVLRHETDLQRAQGSIADVERQLARLTGLALPPLRPGSLPPLDAEMPGETATKTLLVAHHPELGRLRARYEVAERALRLEIVKQYPDLQLGTSFAGDPGETKKVWGLSLGVSLPLFDRNQHGIAAAAGARSTLRARYEATLNEALADLEGRFEAWRLLREEWRLLAEKVLPRAEANAGLSRRMLAAGGTDVLKHLEVERTWRSTMLDALAAELGLRRMVAEMERIVGLPMLLLPGEDRFSPPDQAAPGVGGPNPEQEPKP